LIFHVVQKKDIVKTPFAHVENLKANAVKRRGRADETGEGYSTGGYELVQKKKKGGGKDIPLRPKRKKEGPAFWIGAHAALPNVPEGKKNRTGMPAWAGGEKPTRAFERGEKSVKTRRFTKKKGTRSSVGNT